MGKTVLVVEDRIDTRAMIAEALERSGYSVFHAEDGEQAMELIQKKNIDIVLLDIFLPKKDGKQVLEEIRADKSNDKTKVVIMTASKTNDVTIEYYKKIGANGFIAKPLHIDELRELLKRVAKK